jgi:hypothetical protein
MAKIGSVALLALYTIGHVASAHAASLPSKGGLVPIAARGPQAVTAGPQDAEDDDEAEASDEAESPDGQEDDGPDVDHENEGEESGENGHGGSGQEHGR